MSEKIYAWLLRLFPSPFRETYGDEALQLFRDRARDEKGLLPRVRLWLDLLVDLAASVPREYFHVQPELVGASALGSVNGVPAFYFLENESPRPGALVFGSVLASVALAAFCSLLGAGGRYIGPEAWVPGQSQNELGLSEEQNAPPEPRQAINAPGGEPVEVDAAERQRVIARAGAILRKYYVDRDNAQKMADALVAHAKSGDDDGVTDGTTFAALLTQQMREVNPDRHLTLDYFQSSLPEHPDAETPEALSRYRESMKEQNCTFEKVETLPHNIGYLKLNSFPGLSACQTTAEAVMAALNHADAVIFDLRDNRGGQPAMVMLLAAYLFDHPEYMYNPRENTTEQCWTHSPVPGNKLSDKPAYILISGATFSAAEHFSYDLKMLKRATLVGETSGGGAHSGVWHRIDEHFGMGVPEAKAINPFAKTDWAEIGVEPDVKVQAADALETAVKLARSKVAQKRD